MQDTVEVPRVEAVINACVGPELREAAPPPLANAAPRFMKTGLPESLSLGGSRG